MPDATPFELQSLGHFVQGTSPTLIALEIPHENPNYIYIPLALTSSSKALYHALVASGSAHALNWGLEVSPKDVKRSERMTLSLLEKDMVEVATWLKDGRVDEARLREKVNSLLAVLQTLILYGTTAGDTKLWRKHMQGASSLLAQVAQYEAAQNPLVLNTFLLETIKFLDIQTALSLNCGTTVQYCGVETGWSPNHTVIHPSITGMNGFSGEYLTIVGRICDLSSDLSQPDPNLNPPLPTSTPQLKRSLADIRRAIDSIFSDLESCRARISALEHDPVFRTALLRRLSLGNHASKLDGHFKFADTIYYASHVYLARTLTSAYRLKEESMRFVYEGLDALAMVPWEGSAGNLLGWALVVIGSEIEDDEPARGIVRLRLKALGALGHLNLTQTSVLVEEVWRQKDERNRRGGTQLIIWQNVMKGMGWDLLVV